MVSLLSALIALALPSVSRAQSTELLALQSEFKDQVTVRVSGAYSTALARLDESYAAGLEREFAGAKSSGNLEAALALESEKKRLETRGPLPADDEGAARPLVKLRAIYRAELAKIEAQKARGIALLLPPHIAQLKLLEADLTRANRLAEAKVVMDYRQTLASGTDATLTIQPAAPGGASRPVAVPPKGDSVRVASALQAKGEVQDLKRGAIAFDGPAGDGRRGAKGVLLINDPLTGKNGSTWSFTYSRPGSAQMLEIMHPCGKGQVIVHISKSAVGVSTPKAWTETGYSSGDESSVRKSKEFETVFPLEEGVEYPIVSVLDAQGGLELSISGKVVATARVGSTASSPLSMEIPAGATFRGSGRGVLEFKGENFPMQWAAGYAALLVGPMDGGEPHVCRDVRFWPMVAK